MSFEVKPVFVPSTDNIHILKGKMYIPHGEVKGLFHIVHGMTEHIERYDVLMSYLAEKGYITFGYDNLGHGKTAGNDSELGFIAHKYGWKYLVDDIDIFENEIKKRYPDKDLFLMGHSMGSFIVRLAAEKFPKNCKKLILCGTAGKNPLVPAGLALTKLIGLLKGEKYISNTVLNMAFGSYNKNFEGNTEYEWLTKEKSNIIKYADDKYCTFKFTVSAMHDLIKLNSKCNSASWFKNIRKDMPILLISGERDPVGNYSKGVKWVYSNLKKAGADAQIKIYENCRHEILNDTCRNEVMNDILKFINS